MKQNKPIKVCYVYLQRLKKDNESFTTLVPLRSARMLQGIAEIHLIYTGNINEERLHRHGINCHCYEGILDPIPVLFYIGLMFFIRRIGIDENITIFQNVWRHYMLFPISIGAKMCDSKVIARISGVPIKKKKYKNHINQLKNNIGRFIEKISLWSSDFIITLSHSLKRVFMNRGICPEKMIVLSQGVDSQEFYPSDQVSKNFCNILYVGRLSRLKGLDDLLYAFKEISKEHIKSKLTIAGGANPKVEQKYFDKVCKMNLDGRVEFLGLVEHEKLVDLYKECGLLVLPSYSEGLPNVILEAMASGLPCVGTDVGEIPYLLADGRGIVVEPGNQRQLIKAISDILDRRINTKMMTKKALTYVIQNHSFKTLRKKYTKLFKNFWKGGL